MSRARIAARDIGPPGIGAESSTDVTAVRDLFRSLIPNHVWERVCTSTRVFVAAHRELHRLPFELLVTDTKDGKPVLWLDNGPPISYVPSGTALRWMRGRAAEIAGAEASIDLLAVGDPGHRDETAPVPEQGVLVLEVDPDGEGARVGLQPVDVLTSYDGKPLADDTTLRDLRVAVDAALKAGERPPERIPVEVWRGGIALRVEVWPGLLGIKVASGAARGAHEASLDRTGDAQRFVHKHDLERIRHLPQLRGARAEAEAIASEFRAKQARAELLLGPDATEPAVFDLAAKAKYLHFACHGIAEEYAGQSLSLLVLSQPERVLPGDDGLLKLGDLLHHWRGRLSSCRLVVLSACRTNVGPTLRDEAPQALPIGFLFAGVPSVISSLWAVDDASTRELMTDFYGRLLAGEKDKLAAFTAAKKALRAKYPDPFHWAPFLYIGSPE
jgi:hypothetical protein